LLHASGYALLEGSLPGLFMPPQEKTTCQACSTPNSCAQSGIASERANDSPTGGSSGPARERTLLGFAHAGTAADGDDASHDPR
jgi:hypothetical protein